MQPLRHWHVSIAGRGPPSRGSGAGSAAPEPGERDRLLRYIVAMPAFFRALPLVLLTACASVSEPAIPIAACHEPAAEALQQSMGPVQAIGERLRSGGVVLLGEHHGDVAEIDLLVSVIAALDQPVVLAMELVPVQAPANPELSDWPDIVGDRYWPAPLYFSEYRRVLEALVAARARGVAVQLAGLAPDCRLPEAPSDAHRSEAIACFRGRDAFMAHRLQDLRMEHPGLPILVSAGWRHVSAVRLPGAEKPLGALLPAHWPVERILLAGTEDRAEGAVATCMGGPLFFAGQAEAPVRFQAEALEWRLVDCVDTASTRALSDAFDQVVGLPEAPAPTPWTAADFARVSAEDRAAWDRTHRVLMGRSEGAQEPGSLARLAADDAAELARQKRVQRRTCL